MVALDPEVARSEGATKTASLAPIRDNTGDLARRAALMLDQSTGITVGGTVQWKLRRAIDVVLRAADEVEAADSAKVPGGDASTGGNPAVPAAGSSGAASTGSGGPGKSDFERAGGSGDGLETGGGVLTPPKEETPQEKAEKIRAKYDGVLHPEDCPCVFHTEGYRSAYSGVRFLERPPQTVSLDGKFQPIPAGSLGPTTANGIAEGGCYPPFPSPINFLPPHPSGCPCPYHGTGTYPTPNGPVPFPPDGPIDPNWDNPLPDPKELPTEHADGSATDPWPDGYLSDFVVARPLPMPPVYIILLKRERQLEATMEATDAEIAAATSKREAVNTKISGLNATAAGLRSARELLVAEGAPAESIAAVDAALEKVDGQRSALVEERSKLTDELTELQETKAETKTELEEVRSEMDAISRSQVAGGVLSSESGEVATSVSRRLVDTAAGDNIRAETSVAIGSQVGDNRLREPLLEANSVGGVRAVDSTASSPDDFGWVRDDVQNRVDPESI